MIHLLNFPSHFGEIRCNSSDFDILQTILAENGYRCGSPLGVNGIPQLVKFDLGRQTIGKELKDMITRDELVALFMEKSRGQAM